MIILFQRILIIAETFSRSKPIVILTTHWNTYHLPMYCSAYLAVHLCSKYLPTDQAVICTPPQTNGQLQVSPTLHNFLIPSSLASTRTSTWNQRHWNAVSLLPREASHFMRTSILSWTLWPTDFWLLRRNGKSWVQREYIPSRVAHLFRFSLFLSVMPRLLTRGKYPILDRT